MRRDTLTSAAAAACIAGIATAQSCGAPKAFQNLVAFGDSYSDDGRLGYYISHNGSAPPPGGYQSVSNVTASGGLTWGEWVQQYTGVNFIDYAVSGATCSNEIISRYFSAINKPFPSVLDDEIPSFRSDVNSTTLYPSRTAANTVYALWIGTNDLGFEGFLSDSQAPGTNITTYVECVWQVWDAIYQEGGRRFVLFNNAPLQLTPLYAAESNGGAGNNQYWLNKTSYNETEYQYKILEYTTSANTMFDYGFPFQLLVKKRYPGAQIAIFDVHRLLTDIHNNPSEYLASPANSTGYYAHCVPTNNSICTKSTEPFASFEW
jgi:phospholipase/lecithinase/hemolysin